MLTYEKLITLNRVLEPTNRYSRRSRNEKTGLYPFTHSSIGFLFLLFIVFQKYKLSPSSSPSSHHQHHHTSHHHQQTDHNLAHTSQPHYHHTTPQHHHPAASLSPLGHPPSNHRHTPSSLSPLGGGSGHPSGQSPLGGVPASASRPGSSGNCQTTHLPLGSSGSVTRNDSDSEQRAQGDTKEATSGHFQVLSDSVTVNIYYDGDARSEVEDHFAKAISQQEYSSSRASGSSASEKGKKIHTIRR